MTVSSSPAAWNGRWPPSVPEPTPVAPTRAATGSDGNRRLLGAAHPTTAMRAGRNEASGTWHLLGNRGCGADPDGETVEGSWAEVRDRVDRDDATRCRNCRWP